MLHTPNARAVGRNAGRQRFSERTRRKRKAPHEPAGAALRRARGEGLRERPGEPGHLPSPNALLPSFLLPSLPGAALRSLPREPKPRAFLVREGGAVEGGRLRYQGGPLPQPGEARPSGAGSASRRSFLPPSPPPPPSAGGPEGKPCPSPHPAPRWQRPSPCLTPRCLPRLPSTCSTAAGRAEGECPPPSSFPPPALPPGTRPPLPPAPAAALTSLPSNMARAGCCCGRRRRC